MGASREFLVILRLILGGVAAAVLVSGQAGANLAVALLTLGLLFGRADAAFAGLEPDGDPRTGTDAFLADVTSNALCFLALGGGLHFGHFARTTADVVGPEPWLLGLVAAAVVVVIPLLVRRLEAIDGKRPAEFDGVAGFDADDILILLPIAVLLGVPEGLLLLFAFGGAAFAGGLYMAHFRKFHSLT